MPWVLDTPGQASPDLLKRVEWRESRGNPNAVSPKGAQGAMQLMPDTMADPGFGVKPFDRSAPDPVAENRRMGRDYLNAMLDRYEGDEEAALVAYNWGPGNADKWVSAGRDRAKLPRETQGYLGEILDRRPTAADINMSGPKLGAVGAPKQGKWVLAEDADKPTPELQKAAMAPSIAGPESAPTTGVTIAPKGGDPRQATPAEAEPYLRANILPLARNQNTGGVEPAVPEFLERAFTAPGRAMSGELQVQAPDPVTGEMRSSPEAIQEGVNFAATATPATAGRSSMVTPRATKNPAPTTEELGSMARLAYDRAEKAGLQVKGTAYGQMVKELEVKLAKEGIDPDIHPKASAAARRLIEAGETPKTLQEIDTLRRVVQAAAKSNEPDERRIAKVMIDRIDDFLASLKDGDILAGNAKAGSASIREARSLWQRMRKSEVIDEIFKKAEDTAGANYTQAGFETALRQRFRSLLHSKAIRQFTKEEQAAIRRVVRGGPVENLVRFLGKMAPRGVISGGFNVGVGTVFGPAAGIASTVVGEAARRGATRMTVNNADLARELIRGGQAPRAPVALPGPSPLSAALLSGGRGTVPSEHPR